MTFSIVIPTMWKSDYLLKMIPIYEKSFFVKEIIIIDNDHVNKIDLSIYSKIIYYTEFKNIFVNPAWNIGHKLSNYKLIIANDDIYIPNLDEVLNIINKSDYDIIGLDWNDKENLKIEKIDEFRKNGFGCFMYIKKYTMIPEEFKIFRGDFWLFKNSIKRGILSNPLLGGEIGKTRKSNSEFHNIGVNDLEIYDKKYKHLE